MYTDNNECLCSYLFSIQDSKQEFSKVVGGQQNSLRTEEFSEVQSLQISF